MKKLINVLIILIVLFLLFKYLNLYYSKGLINLQESTYEGKGFDSSYKIYIYITLEIINANDGIISLKTDNLSDLGNRPIAGKGNFSYCNIGHNMYRLKLPSVKFYDEVYCEIKIVENIIYGEYHASPTFMGKMIGAKKIYGNFELYKKKG